ncbi:MAG: endolytic transglycosylase MltG [Pseudohongiellaceae bacterium]
MAELEAPVDIVVVPGSSLSRISENLAAAGQLKRPRLLRALARLRGVSDSIQAGEYRLEPGITQRELLDKLVAGDTIQYRVTLVEGWTFRQALETLWALPRLEHRLQNMSDAEIVAQITAPISARTATQRATQATTQSSTSTSAAFVMPLTTQENLPLSSPEGMIFPDTYFYTSGTSDIELLRRAHARLLSVLMESWNKRDQTLPLASPYEALILASIVEKESGLATERDIIAGVFLRRLQSNMRLQSDPTVLYGRNSGNNGGDDVGNHAGNDIGKDVGSNSVNNQIFAGDITQQDLDTATAYNTYRIDGLPPTPIALVSREALAATMNPEATEYLYFVARGDGSHVFSTTLEQHNAAVARYQQNLENTTRD